MRNEAKLILFGGPRQEAGTENRQARYHHHPMCADSSTGRWVRRQPPAVRRVTPRHVHITNPSRFHHRLRAATFEDTGTTRRHEPDCMTTMPPSPFSPLLPKKSTSGTTHGLLLGQRHLRPGHLHAALCVCLVSSLGLPLPRDGSRHIRLAAACLPLPFQQDSAGHDMIHPSRPRLLGQRQRIERKKQSTRPLLAFHFRIWPEPVDNLLRNASSQFALRCDALCWPRPSGRQSRVGTGQSPPPRRHCAADTAAAASPGQATNVSMRAPPPENEAGVAAWLQYCHHTPSHRTTRPVFHHVPRTGNPSQRPWSRHSAASPCCPGPGEVNPRHGSSIRGYKHGVNVLSRPPSRLFPPFSSFRRAQFQKQCAWPMAPPVDDATLNKDRHDFRMDIWTPFYGQSWPWPSRLPRLL